MWLWHRRQRWSSGIGRFGVCGLLMLRHQGVNLYRPTVEKFTKAAHMLACVHQRQPSGAGNLLSWVILPLSFELQSSYKVSSPTVLNYFPQESDFFTETLRLFPLELYCPSLHTQPIHPPHCDTASSITFLAYCISNVILYPLFQARCQKPSFPSVCQTFHTLHPLHRRRFELANCEEGLFVECEVGALCHRASPCDAWSILSQKVLPQWRRLVPVRRDWFAALHFKASIGIIWLCTGHWRSYPGVLCFGFIVSGWKGTLACLYAMNVDVSVQTQIVFFPKKKSIGRLTSYGSYMSDLGPHS